MPAFTGTRALAFYALTGADRPVLEDATVGLFNAIMSKIFHRKAAPAASSAPATPAATAAPTAPQPATAAAPAPAPIDVEAVLTELAQQHGGGGNWRTSIVDLLKLLDLDSSLAARKELAEELHVNAGPHGSAEQNIALQKAVWKALADNGGVVPASLRD